MNFFDISPVIDEALKVWPGDVPFKRKVSMAFPQAHLELSSFESTVHLGSHVDSPRHYHARGITMEEVDPTVYFGPAQVIEVKVERGERILPKHIQKKLLAPRVLLKTNTFPDPQNFNEDFAALSPELIDDLCSQGVKLFGIDTPSVDLFDDKVLLSHLKLYERNCANLEGIFLSHVPEGLYWLQALPLRLKGFDASPVRAMLSSLDEIIALAKKSF